MPADVQVEHDGERFALKHGDVVIAAITSCTNTSNPSVMLGAGLLAKKAVERGLEVKPWVKTSLAPGSKVVTRYLDEAGLTPTWRRSASTRSAMAARPASATAARCPSTSAGPIDEGNLVVAAVLSGNRNFEGRIHPLVQANFLASPPLVVAYALAGTVDIDLTNEPLGARPERPAGLPARPLAQQDEIRHAIAPACPARDVRRSSTARLRRATRLEQDPGARGRAVRHGTRNSTYIQEPPFFVDLTPEPARRRRHHAARRCWRCWATASPPTISRRRASIAAEQPGRALSDRARGDRRASSTSTARAAATTR